MSLKNKLMYWCCGGWLIDVFFGWSDAENKKITGEDNGKEPSVLTYKCNSDSFCEHVRSKDGGLFCGKERPGQAVDCPHAVKVG